MTVTIPGVKVNIKPYKISEAQQKAVSKEIKNILELGIIEESTSEWTSPKVLILYQMAAYTSAMIFINWETHLVSIQAACSLTANPKKCCLAMKEAKYLGFTIGRGLNKPQLNKIEAFQNWPHPVIKKTEKEALAIKWEFDNLRYYFLGRRFKLVTDHALLKWMFVSKGQNASVMTSHYGYSVSWFLRLCMAGVFIIAVLSVGVCFCHTKQVQKSAQWSASTQRHVEDEELAGLSSDSSQAQPCQSLVSSRPPSTILLLPQHMTPHSSQLLEEHTQQEGAPETEQTDTLSLTDIPPTSPPSSRMLTSPAAQMSLTSSPPPNPVQCFWSTWATQQNHHLDCLKTQVQQIATQAKNTKWLNTNVTHLTTEITRVANTLEQMRSDNNRFHDSFLRHMEDNKKCHQTYLHLLESNLSYQQTVIRLMESQTIPTRDLNSSISN
ncbi:uncharacterized protein LOC134933948 [Pseudophryne corroboree]|uniref:uncharacterized protein LOC134933948 n=1 Tax=Pseudophryne corroboree TaxID=495146 RepID=UPI0030819285